MHLVPLFVPNYHKLKRLKQHYVLAHGAVSQRSGVVLAFAQGITDRNQGVEQSVSYGGSGEIPASRFIFFFFFWLLLAEFRSL